MSEVEMIRRCLSEGAGGRKDSTNVFCCFFFEQQAMLNCYNSWGFIGFYHVLPSFQRVFFSGICRTVGDLMISMGLVSGMNGSGLAGNLARLHHGKSTGNLESHECVAFKCLTYIFLGGVPGSQIQADKNPPTKIRNVNPYAFVELLFYLFGWMIIYI